MVTYIRVLHGSYFANPPEPAMLKTASDRFSDRSTNYIPYRSRPAINSYRRLTENWTDAICKNESKPTWAMGVLGGRKHMNELI